MTSADYETTRVVQANVDGITREGHFRVMSGSVIVYYESEIKFAEYGLNRPEVVARWLLSDLCRRVDANKSRGSSSR